MNLIELAKNFAHDGHDSIGQKRKFRGFPYWKHTDEVAYIVQAQNGDNNQIMAAHLHDLFEDVNKKGVINDNLKYGLGRGIYFYNLETIYLIFGKDVANLVLELTNFYTKEKFPYLNRKERKELEIERLMNISQRAKLIKLADIYSNIKDIYKHDKKFAKVYIEEKIELLNKWKSGFSLMDQIHLGNLFNSALSILKNNL